jgi:rubredoxin
MKKLVRCRVCGYVMDEDKLNDACPACGVSRKVFEPYEDPVEPTRRRYLALDVHPVIVHVPQALTFLMMLMLVCRPFLPAAWLDDVSRTIVVMASILPFTAIGAFASGLADGKVRFRKFMTPMLRQKIFIGSAYLLLTLAMMWFAVLNPGDDSASGRILLILSLLAFAACTWLGIIGAKLLPAIFVKRSSAAKPTTTPPKATAPERGGAA